MSTQKGKGPETGATRASAGSGTRKGGGDQDRHEDRRRGKGGPLPDDGGDDPRRPDDETPIGDPPQDEERTIIATADDVNVDEDNAIESPTENLTANDPEEPEEGDGPEEKVRDPRRSP